MSIPTVSVVMATYQRRAFLPRVLDAFLSDPDLTEIVVVVDGAQDGSFEFLRERAADDPRIRPLWQENTGASRAQQAGAEAAASDVLLMFDDDQIAGPALASRHALRHAGEQGLIVVGNVPPPPPGPRSRAHEIGYADSYADACRRFALGAPVLTELWGGNLSVRRADLLRVGWSNPAFPHRYHYDLEFGLRCAEAGMRGVYDRSLGATHEYSRSLGDLARESRERGRAMRCVAELHPGSPAVQTDLIDNREPGYLRAITGRPRLRAAAARLGVPATELAYRLRLRRFERLFGYVVMLAEGRTGALEEAARLREAAR